MKNFARAARIYTSAPERRPLRILVVEDEFLLRWAIAETLKQSGHTVLEAWDAPTTAGAFASARGTVDVAVLDYGLPDSTGRALLETIRRISPATAVVMMTADAPHEAIRAVSDVGVHEILIKPFELPGLEDVLLEACGSPSPEQTPVDVGSDWKTA